MVKGTFDELVLGSARHELRFGLYRDGEPEPAGTPMFEDCAHRVLFGDPAAVPWKTPVATTHELHLKRVDGGLSVSLRWTELAQDPWVWDPWRERVPGEEERGRLVERIALGDAPAGTPEVMVERAVAVRGETRTPIALTACALLERDLDGSSVLHLEAQGLRREMDAYGVEGGPEALEASFTVRFRAPQTGR